MGDEWGISTNDSDFAQSLWSYSNLSNTTEQWIEDPFMESVQDHTLTHEDGINNFVDHESLMDTSPDGAYSSLPSADESVAAPMSPTPDQDTSYPTFGDPMWTSGSGLLDDYRPLSASPHHSGTHPTSNEPWDPLGHPRVRQFECGYVAFADSPKSSSDQSSCEVPSDQDILPQEITIQDSQDARLESISLESPAVSNQQQLKWEPISVATHGYPRNNNTTWRGTDRRPRKGRCGPLDIQKAEDARIMRGIGACWPCRVSKVKCSPGSPCETCQDHQLPMSALSYQVCCRSSFADFEVLYFPAVLTGHFNKEEVKSLISRNVESFIGPGRLVRVHCGRAFAPIELTVHFFRHKTDILLNRHHFTGPGKERALRMIIRRCAPVGMLGVDIGALKKECLSCIKSMVSHVAYARQVTAGDKSGIYRRALEIVHRYSKAEENCLLEKAMELHAMHYFMARILTFTKDSASMVKRVSRNDLGLDLPSDVISSRLLSRQIKHAMHILHRRQTKAVLEEFESHLKKREQAGWPISFCIVIILCLCMEDIQIAANNFVFTDSEISLGLRSQSLRACWELEDKPYRQCTQLFHDMYRSYKRTNSHAPEKGFNPISRDESHQDNWGQATEDMLHDIRLIISDCEPEMRALSTVSVFDGTDQPDHHSLLEDHPARLLSKFLLSFLDEP